jgi:hypothetical protein
MAKRYHKSKRMEDSYNDRGRASGNYGMLHEDPSAPALLPRNVMQKYYGNPHYSAPESAPDLYMGVERMLEADNRDFKKAFKLSKP